jgi:GrpB-like predicted nucleotidyltransferase (UPF0157 family)
MASVVVVPWSSDWPLHFATVRAGLQPLFAPGEAIVEHIGSTSVPGLAAKPVIDVMLGAATLADIEARIGRLAGIGYTYVPKHERALPMRRYFTSDVVIPLRVHLHAVETGSALWREHLAFRDALRADPALCDAYQALKLQLARTFAHDKAAYTEAKGPFIRSVLAGLRPAAP